MGEGDGAEGTGSDSLSLEYQLVRALLDEDDAELRLEALNDVAGESGSSSPSIGSIAGSHCATDRTEAAIVSGRG